MIKFEYLVFLSMNSMGNGNCVVMKTAANEKISSTITTNEDLNIKQKNLAEPLDWNYRSGKKFNRD